MINFCAVVVVAAEEKFILNPALIAKMTSRNRFCEGSSKGE